MKQLLSNIGKTLFASKGMLHLIVATAFIYDFMYWGAVPHKNPQLVWHDAFKTLYELGAEKYFIYTFIILLVAFVYEMMQRDIFNAIFQKWDVFCSAMGAPVAFILWAIVPESAILFYICLSICLFPVVQFIYWLIKRKR